MRTTTTLSLILTLLTAPIALGYAQDDTSALPTLPATPSQATRPVVIHVQEVTLEQEYETDFRKERSLVASGWLIVLRGRGDVLAPRALAQPLLLADGEGWIESVEWFNHGVPSGVRVAFIPRTSDAAKAKQALAAARVWFGTPGLPEQVDARRLTEESARANSVGLARQRLATTAPALALKDREALLAAANALVKRHAESEASPEVAPAVPAAPK
jgi:hypothetical protein